MGNQPGAGEVHIVISAMPGTLLQPDVGQRPAGLDVGAIGGT